MSDEGSLLGTCPEPPRHHATHGQSDSVRIPPPGGGGSLPSASCGGETARPGVACSQTGGTERSTWTPNRKSTFVKTGCHAEATEGLHITIQPLLQQKSPSSCHGNGCIKWYISPRREYHEMFSLWGKKEKKSTFPTNSPLLLIIRFQAHSPLTFLVHMQNLNVRGRGEIKPASGTYFCFS